MRHYRDCVPVSPYALLALTAFFWSSNFVVGRALHDEVPPVALAFWRWVVAAVALAPFAWRQLWADRAALQRQAGMTIVLGILGISVFNTFVYVGLGSTTATNALLLNSTIPIIIAVINWLAFSQRLTRLQTVGVAVSLSGVAVIVFRGTWAGLVGLRFNAGDLWIFAAGLNWAIYTVLLRKRPQGVGALAFLLATMLVGVAVLAPAYAVESALGARIHLSLTVVAALVYIGVVPSVLAFTFWNQGVAAVGANKAGVFIHPMPVFGTALAVIFLHETVHGYQLAGIALILIGILLVTRRTDSRS